MKLLKIAMICIGLVIASQSFAQTNNLVDSLGHTREAARAVQSTYMPIMFAMKGVHGLGTGLCLAANKADQPRVWCVIVRVRSQAELGAIARVFGPSFSLSGIPVAFIVEDGSTINPAVTVNN